MDEKLKQIKEELAKKFDEIKNMQELNDLRVAYQGKKGIITELAAGIKDVAAEHKKEFGMKMNDLKNDFNEKFEDAKRKFEEERIKAKLKEDTIDISLPATKVQTGSKHPFNRII